jgi:hypothetical protein
MAGLSLVLPVAVLLAVGAGGPERSLLVLGPQVTAGLPVVAMVAFWWDDWPGTVLRPDWSGWADTALVGVAALVLTVVGQAATGRVDLRAVVEPFPGPGHVPTFPGLLPLVATAFVAMLQLTLVCEGWPLRRLRRIPAGICAVGVSWAVALLAYSTLLGGRPFTGNGPDPGRALVSGEQLASALTVLGAWQVAVFVLWRGWPVAGVVPRWLRILAGNVLVAAGTAATLALAGLFGMPGPRVSATAACFVAAALVVGMLFEGAGLGGRSAALERIVALVLVVVGAGLLDRALARYAGGVQWRRASDEAWVTHAALNALAVSVILHVGVGRRWPFGRRTRAEG